MAQVSKHQGPAVPTWPMGFAIPLPAISGAEPGAGESRMAVNARDRCAFAVRPQPNHTLAVTDLTRPMTRHYSPVTRP